VTFLSYIWPRLVLSTTTEFNHDIRVIEESGEAKLLVDGSRQSGAYIRRLWEGAFTKFHIDRTVAVGKILVLGTAGGSVIHILRNLFADSPITAVDIDPVMITIGYEHFGLKELSDLTVVQKEAREFIGETLSKKVHYDMIVVDLFSGRDIPSFVYSVKFLRQLAGVLSERGILVINYLRERQYGEKSDVLFAALQTLFLSVSDHKAYRNRFFYARNRFGVIKYAHV